MQACHKQQHHSCNTAISDSNAGLQSSSVAADLHSTPALGASLTIGHSTPALGASLTIGHSTPALGASLTIGHSTPALGASLTIGHSTPALGASLTIGGLSAQNIILACGKGCM
ncbi:hypothetical protein P7K49_001089 [Saguinus oedipus]|uniref:Uncharacterized protein n=1 Tax=Saguinus oedipus TaxID=9490 RepID=A0ABQ9WDK5_SAGOE|nr:hypothetical protein P7K49_001089 [Saguinus oedipus]